MADYSSYINDLRSRIDIVEVIQKYLPLKRSGSNMKGLCPFHKEKTPSFMVNPQKQFFHCFGCNEGGDVVGFIRKIENLTFYESLMFISREYGLPAPPRPSGVGSEAEADARERRRRDLLALCAEADSFYRRSLFKEVGAGARRYLEDRGVSREMGELFGLGYAPPGWQALYDHLRSKNFSEELMIEAGVCKKNDSGRMYDMLVGRLVFPLQDQTGETVAFAGRILEDGEPKYLNTPQTVLYNKSQLLYGLAQSRDVFREHKEALILEGYLDVITAHQYGITNTLATCGTALTEDHARRLRRFVDNVVLLFDADSAGQKATLRGIEVLLAGGHKGIRVCRLKDGDDPDSFLHSEGVEAFAAALSEAKDYWDYLVEYLKREFPLNRPDGKDRAVETLKPFIQAVKSEVIRQELVKIFSEVLDVRDDVLWRAVRPRRQRKTGEPGESDPAIMGGEDQREMLVLRVLLENISMRGQLIQLSDQEGFWDWFQVEEVRNWIKKLLSPIWHELSLDDILKSDLSGDELSFLRRVSLIGENENLNSPDAALGYLRTSLLLLEYNSLNRLHKVLHSLLEETNWDDTKLMAKYKEVGMQKMHIREYLNGRPEGSKL